MNRFKIRCLGLLLLIGSCAVQAGAACNLDAAESLWGSTHQRLQTLFGQAVAAPRIVIEPEAPKPADSDALVIFGRYEHASQTLHIVCRVQGKDWFASAVRHEATHHYLSQAFGRLPLWLNEGLATYMEYESLDAARANLPINRDRLKEFIELLKWGRAPSLHQLLHQNPYAHGASEYYAAYWALTFALLHHPDEAIQRQRRELLLERLRAAPNDSSRMDQLLVDGLLKEKPDTQSWEQRWRQQLWGLR